MPIELVAFARRRHWIELAAFMLNFVIVAYLAVRRLCGTNSKPEVARSPAVPRRKAGGRPLATRLTPRSIRDRPSEEALMSCTKRHVVVTGASTGIGRATALRLCRDGFHVFATVRRREDAEHLEQAASEGLTAILMDVTVTSEIAAAAESVRTHLGDGGLDALVNNAGVGLAWPIELIPLEKLREQFGINVEGQIAVTQAFLPLIRRVAGRIVMIGSIGDRITMPFGGALCSTKHALRSLTDALRMELAPWNIRVILVEPASIRTDAVDKFERNVRQAEQDFGKAGWALYGDAFSNMTARALAEEMRGSPPDVVAAVVSRALDQRRPRTRYVAGNRARLLATLAKLPAPILDGLRRKIFNLPRPGAKTNGVLYPRPSGT
jgi:NAD(P)-dependent dehydrogenase (short-subunit alcohol dehydrogenase family)